MQAHVLIDRLNTQYSVAVRVKLQAEVAVSPWSKWFTVPVVSYIETASTGPYPIREVEWVEVNPFVVENRGRLIMPRMLNYEQQIREAFEAEKIRFEQIGLVFRIYLP
ncbi:DUF6678 family protein [Hymenobacter cellulosivorans]|uniref:Uncharacterized protein n=1 Tax=Hymenobacter cellulosivorans TaxID=2932249 RepID=A0ABY4FF49_9BACT|nr:DUF6678 family protein [Hymenobacter cellulosivorans]UOQ54642.1 hypothetical protein MUN80_07730 [Hymenobacter cellulosivorans]